MKSPFRISNGSVFSFLSTILLVGFIAIGALTAHANASNFMFPDRTISGEVTDEKGEPLIGATVIAVGTSSGTTTDVDGSFTLTVPDNGAVLEVSYVGYVTQKVSVGDQTKVSITLELDQQQLEEVVVVGYGTAKVKDLTGSVARIGEDDFIKGVNVSPDQAIQGKVAGVNIINNSGQPGGAVTFRIRGNTSIRAGQQPLFVVDGVPLDGRNTNPGSSLSQLGSAPDSNPLSFLNPNDIASIDILKDASATAIYGSRGANGVVIVTTKKGRSGAPKVDVRLTSAVSNMAANIDLLSADQFRQVVAQREFDVANYDGGTSVDAFDAITRTAWTKTASVSIGGGNQRGTYRISGGLHDQQGIIKESGIKRYNGSFTGAFNMLNDAIKVDVNLIASRTAEEAAPIADNSNIFGSLVMNAIEWNPTVPFEENGTFVQEKYNSVQGIPTNPLALLAYHRDLSSVNNTLASVGVTWNITDFLNYKINFGTNRSVGRRNSDLSGRLFLNEITDIGNATITQVDNSSNTLTHTLNANKRFGSLNVSGLLGYEYQNYKRFSTSMSGRDFTNFDVWGSDIMGNVQDGNISVSSFRDPTNELQSYFARVFFNFKEKYLFRASLRSDGSTKFGKNNQYGLFPAFSAAWVLSKEAAFSSLDNLKLRVGWGRTGNQEFPAGAAQERYSYGQGTLALANVANPDLKWETSEVINIGLDFSILNSRVSGSIEYFDKKTNDLLFLLPTIQPAPSANFWINLPATVNNSGLELTLNTFLVNKENFIWDLGINGTWLQNELTGYDGVQVPTGEIKGNGLGGSGATSQVLANNQPLFAFYMPTFEGFDDSGAALYSEESAFVGDPNPDFLVGLTSTMEYKNWSLRLSFNGAFGHQVYNNTANAVLTVSNLVIGRNVSPEVGFSEENLGNSNTVSTRYLEDGDFIRLQNAVLSYRFANLKTFNNLECFLAAQNLFVITDYSGFDPEVNTDRGFNGIPSFGIEYIPYPMARTFTLGVNVSF